jgi:hypothetical protein
MTSEAASIPRTARITGAFWLAVILIGGVGEFTLAQIFTAQDPARTANAMLGAEGLMRVSIAANLLVNACYAVVTVLLYDLLRPVNRTLARLAMVFGIFGLGLGFFAVVLQIAPLVLLDGTWLASFTKAQVQSLAYAPLALRMRIFPLGMSLFGVQMATCGYLIARSGFLPQWLGIVLGTGGTVYVVNSLAIILVPSLTSILFPVMAATAFLGEGTLTFWLLIKSIDSNQWGEAESRSAMETSVTRS